MECRSRWRRGFRSLAADDAAVIERRDQDEAKKAKHGHGIAQIAERHQRCRARNNDLGFFEGNDAEEKSDAGRYRQLQIPRSGIDDVFADPKNEIKKKMTPEQKTAASACCQLYFHGNTSVKAKNALSPMPGASAIG